MIPDIRTIKSRRKKMDITQKQLSHESNVSQSLIAKLEAGKAEASYEKVKRIFEALDRARKKDEKKAEEVMTQEIIKVKPDNKVGEVIKMMKKYEISQLPVFLGTKQIGSISDTLILSKMDESKDIHKELVKNIMEDPLPTVNKNNSITSLLPILKETGAVLVLDKGRLVGLISKSDVL